MPSPDVQGEPTVDDVTSLVDSANRHIKEPPSPRKQKRKRLDDEPEEDELMAEYLKSCITKNRTEERMMEKKMTKLDLECELLQLKLIAVKKELGLPNEFGSCSRE